MPFGLGRLWFPLTGATVTLTGGLRIPPSRASYLARKSAFSSAAVSTLAFAGGVGAGLTLGRLALGLLTGTEPPSFFVGVTVAVLALAGV